METYESTRDKTPCSGSTALNRDELSASGSGYITKRKRVLGDGSVQPGENNIVPWIARVAESS
jgi:hypothetical protein